MIAAGASPRLQRLELVGARPEADLFGLFQRGLPFDIGVAVLEMVVVDVYVLFGKTVAQLAVGDRRGLQARVGTGLIQRDGIKAGEHPNIRQDGRIVFAMAVAVGADILHQTDVEGRPAMADGGGVFGHLPIQHFGGGIVRAEDDVLRAGADAAAAALAQVVIDVGLVILEIDGAAAAILGAVAAADAVFGLGDDGLAVGVLIHLPGAAAAAHADILDGPAEAGQFVALKMVEGDEDVRVHDGAADLGVFDVFAVRNGHLDLIRAAQAVRDENLTAGRHGPEAVELRAVQVIQRVIAAAHIERAAICEERAAALLLTQIRHHLRVIGAQEGQIAQFAEMHFDGDEALIHFDTPETGGEAQTAQLFRQRHIGDRAEIGEPYGGFVHG